jgi:hypothetical protein
MNNILKYNFYKRNLKNNVMVILCEEFGYKQWFWFPNMTGPQLEKWWKRQWNMTKFNNKRNLPGIVFQAETKNESLLNDNQYFDWLYKKWHTLYNLNIHYKAHLFCDDYSWLISPTNRRILHNNYYPAKKQTELNIEMFKNDLPRKNL